MGWSGDQGNGRDPSLLFLFSLLAIVWQSYSQGICALHSPKFLGGIWHHLEYKERDKEDCEGQLGCISIFW